ncbi:MAG: hypothetical protein LAO51_19575 [Acidobacteriia bacterium]|nr:hypothetical protein [Terriglobia bacterium]
MASGASSRKGVTTRDRLSTLVGVGTALTFIVCAACGCAVSGHYRSSGPCKGFHTQPQACERAAANFQAIALVLIGQSIEDVRKIMPNPPDRRVGDEQSEAWSYITDYANAMMTTVVFRGGKVSEIKQAPWIEEPSPKS